MGFGLSSLKNVVSATINPANYGLSKVGAGFSAGLSNFIPSGSSALSFLGGERRNSAQTSAANRQMDFQANMSGTAYQRAMADMRKAGLNPILAAKLGGASSPGGAQPLLHDTITPALQTGFSAKQTQASTALQEEQAKKTHEQIQQVKDEILNIREIRNLTNKQAQKVAQEVHKVLAEIGRINALKKGHDFDNVLKGILSNNYKKYPLLLILKDMKVDGRLIGQLFQRFRHLFPNMKSGKGPLKPRPSITPGQNRSRYGSDRYDYNTGRADPLYR